LNKRRRKLWDNHKIIGTVHKSDRTRLQVELVAKDGVKIINIREWYLKKSDNEWKPNGLAGFAIPILAPINGIPTAAATELIKMMLETINQSKDFAIHDPEHEIWTGGDTGD